MFAAQIPGQEAADGDAGLPGPRVLGIQVVQVLEGLHRRRQQSAGLDTIILFLMCATMIERLCDEFFMDVEKYSFEVSFTDLIKKLSHYTPIYLVVSLPSFCSRFLASASVSSVLQKANRAAQTNDELSK